MPAVPKFTLYTSKISPYGQRVNILLHHLQVPFEEVLIPLDRPRESWFLTLNPRGLIPTLKIEDTANGKEEVVVESALICRFLLDLAPSWGEEYGARADQVLPRGHDLATATARYRQSLFLDTYFVKLQAAGRAMLFQRTEESRQAFVAAAEEIEPVCPQRKGHYFDDSETITLVEVLCGPFLMRVDAHLRWGLTPDAAGLMDRLHAKAPNFCAWVHMLAGDERIKAGTWDEEVQRKYTTDRLAKLGGGQSQT